MYKRMKNSGVEKFLSLEAEVSDGPSEEEEDDDEFEDFFNEEDMHSDRLTPAPPRIPQPSESPEELEKIAESIKDRYRSYREARESLDDQVFQITVTRGFESAIRGRLLALDETYGVREVHERHYLPGRLWIVTSQPEKLDRALWDCNITKKARRIWANNASPNEFLEWAPESSPNAGQWVRGTRGLYKGDLALVLGHSSSTDILQIAVVPRLLSVALPQSKNTKPAATHLEKKRKISSRPAPCVFNPLAAEMQSNAQTQEKGDNATTRNTVQTLDRTISSDDPYSSRITLRHPDGTPRSPHEGEILQQTCYRYNNVIYIGGLLVKNICGSEYRLERSPLKHELLPFVDSKIWPAVVLPLFISMHWKEGDKVFARGIAGTIVSTETAAETQTAIVRSDAGLEGACVAVGIAELQRRWDTGDGVRVIAGVDAGKHGIVVIVEADPPYLQLLDNDSLATIRVPVDYVESFVASTTINQQPADHQQLRRDAKSPLLNLPVIVVKGAEKGRTGEIRAASGCDDKFLVSLGVMTPDIRRIERQHLAILLEDNVQGSRLNDKTDEELLREVHFDRVHRRAIERTMSVRARTPENATDLGAEAGDSLGSFGVQQYDTPEFPDWTLTAQAPSSFLLDNDLWRSLGSNQIHVSFVGVAYDGGRWAGRNALTCPSASTNSRGIAATEEVAIELKDKKQKRVTLVLSCTHLKPCRPAKKGQYCIILGGEYRSELVEVTKIKKLEGTATVLHSDASLRDEPLDGLCWVGNTLV